MKKVNSLVLCSVALAALSACGGGGSTAPVTSVAVTYSATCTGGAIATSTISQADALAKCPNLGSANLVLSVPISTYPALSEEKSAFDLLNSERSRCGFGLLAQSSQLDIAAKAHNDYQIINNLASHLENKELYPVGFTGVLPLDRALAANYLNPGQVGDEFTQEFGSLGKPNKAGMGARGIRRLLNAPYHLAGLVTGLKDVGVSARINTDTVPAGVNVGNFLHISTGVKNGESKQLIAISDFVSYPCEGSTGVDRSLTNETPNPVPGRDLAFNPLGTSIYMAVREGQTLVIATVTMVNASTNLPILLRTPITKDNDPYSAFKGNEAYVIPDAPLLPLTSYKVQINGTNNGASFAKQFTFTTS